MTINYQPQSVNVTGLFTGWLINSGFGSWCHHSVLTRSVHPQLWPMAGPGQCWAGLLGTTRLVWTHLWCHAHSHTSRGFLLSNQQPEPVVWWSTCCEWPVNRDGKSTHILYLSKSTSTHSKKYCSKSKKYSLSKVLLE